MKYEDVKPGMRLRITRTFPSNTDGWCNEWVPEMNEYIGTTQVVQRINNTGVSFRDVNKLFPWQVLARENDYDRAYWKNLLDIAGHLFEFRWYNLIKAYVEGSDIQCQTRDGIWVDREQPEFEAAIELYRLKPTIKVNGCDVPMPATTKPATGQSYYLPSLDASGMSELFSWENDEYDERVFARGLVHLAKEDAEKRAKAMMGFNPYTGTTETDNPEE